MYSIKIHPLAVASVHNNYYLPQYLAFLNPIEECFSVIKSCVKNLLHFNVENCTATRGRQDDDCSGLGGLSPHVVTLFSRLVSCPTTTTERVRRWLAPNSERT